MGDRVQFDFQNAQNDFGYLRHDRQWLCGSRGGSDPGQRHPALQAAQAATNQIPILATSITESGVALGLDAFDGTVGGNISGTSDLAPLEQQADMILEWVPEAKTAGLVFCSAEANSQYQVDEVQKFPGGQGSRSSGMRSLTMIWLVCQNACQ